MKKTTKKLDLNVATIRTLDQKERLNNDQLQNVVGGVAGSHTGIASANGVC